MVLKFGLCCYYVSEYATGKERKEDGKPCVTSVTIILFEITLRHFPLNRCFCKDQKTLMLSEDHDITAQLIALSRLSHTSVLPFSSFCRVSLLTYVASLQTRFATIKCYTIAVCFSYNYVVVLKENE